MLTLGEMVSRVSNRIQKSDSTFQSHIKEWIDERYDALWNKHDWPQKLESRESGVTFIATEAFMILPEDVDTVVSLTERANNRNLFALGNAQAWRSFSQNMDDAGKPINYMPAGIVQHVAQPTATETIEALSSSTLDTTQTVRIWCFVGGVETTQTITLNGTTAAQNASPITCDVGGFLRASKEQSTTGAVTIRGNTSSTTYLQIAPEAFTTYHERIRLRHVPDNDDTLSIIYKKKRAVLINDQDVPNFDCSTALVRGAYADALDEQKQHQRAAVQEAKYDKIIDDLMTKYFIHPEHMDQAQPHIEISQRGLNVGTGSFRNQFGD